MLFDICVNLLNSQFNDDRDAVIARAAAAGVAQFMITATDLASSQLALAHGQHNRFRSTAGVHPHDVGQALPGWQASLADIAANTEVAAIGETGLDFNRNYTPRTAQIDGFDAQIELAQDTNKPLFVHDRESQGEVLRRLIAKSHQRPLPAVVIHCFTGTEPELRSYLEAGFSIGITGWICDKRRGETLRELVHLIPLTQLMLETDAPFLKPHNAPSSKKATNNNQGMPEAAPQKHHKRRNEPALLTYVWQQVSQLRDETADDIAKATTANAQRFFGFH